MKALSIKQPWASLIAHGIKDIENRTWKTKFRGRIYIHASAPKKFNIQLTDEQTLAAAPVLKTAFEGTMSFGAIIGEVFIVDCVINHPSIWAEKTILEPNKYDKKYWQTESVNKSGFKSKEYIKDLRTFRDSKPIYNWVLANAKLYDKPILNVKGKLSFWETDYIHCENCDKPFHCDEITSNDEAQWFCNSCVEESKKEIL
jgi:hypothetical protein